MIGSTLTFKYKKSPPPIKLSLVALMDIFTILVFFLLMNSGESQKIENAKFIKLPDSASTAAPHADLKIFVDEENIWLDDEIVAKITDVKAAPEKVIEPLANALEAHTEKRGKLSAYETAHGLGVTVMADRHVPYFIMKSIMATCAGQNFRDISFAVNQVASLVFSSEPAASNATGLESGLEANAASSDELSIPAALNEGQ